MKTKLKAIIAAAILVSGAASAAQDKGIIATNYRCDDGSAMTVVWNKRAMAVTEIWFTDEGGGKKRIMPVSEIMGYQDGIVISGREKDPKGYSISADLLKHPQKEINLNRAKVLIESSLGASNIICLEERFIERAKAEVDSEFLRRFR